MDIIELLNRTNVSNEQSHFSIINLLLTSPVGSEESKDRQIEAEQMIKEHFNIFFNSLKVHTDLVITCHFYDGKFMIDDRVSILFKGWTDAESMNKLKLKDFQSYEILKSIGMTIQNANK